MYPLAEWQLRTRREERQVREAEQHRRSIGARGPLGEGTWQLGSGKRQFDLQQRSIEGVIELGERKQHRQQQRFDFNSIRQRQRFDHKSIRQRECFDHKSIHRQQHFGVESIEHDHNGVEYLSLNFRQLRLADRFFGQQHAAIRPQRQWQRAAV